MKEHSLEVHAREIRKPVRLVEVEDLIDRTRHMFDLIARRAYEIFESNGRRLGHDLEDWFRAESKLLHPVRADVQESDDALIVCADVPGFDARELEVSVEPRRVTVVGTKGSSEKRKGGQEAIHTERHFDQIFRVLDLPAEVDPTKATATLRDGILELRMPRAAKAQKVRIEPKAA